MTRAESDVPTIGQDPRVADVEQLAAKAVHALRSVEWHGPRHEGQRVCPYCYGARDDGHDAGCLIDTALRRAAELGL